MSKGLLLAALLLPQSALGAEDLELCPIASERLHRSVAYGESGTLLRAPQDEQETAAVLGAIYTGKQQQRRDAIIRAALQGNLLAFRYLVDIKDWDGVYTYANNYLNEDGTVCLAPRIERTLRRNLQKREAGRRLVALLNHNTYQYKRTYTALTKVPFDSMGAHQWVAFAQAITATHIPEIDADVLEFARDLLPFETPLQNRVLPGLHRHYVDYFAKRGYRPAIGYFRALLQAASRDEPLESFQIEYGMLRTVVYRGLASLGGGAARRGLIAELNGLARKPLDAFAAAELQTLSAQVGAFTARGEIDDVVSAYARMLNTSQIPRYDYDMRRTVYPVLGGFLTPTSARLLTAQLEAFLADKPPPNRDANVSLILQALNNFPELDIDPLLALVGNLKTPSERRMMWSLVARHPSDAGVSFLLQQLSFALRGGPQARDLMGPGASEALLDELSGLPGASFQYYARDGIDSLYDQGLLEPAAYERASDRFASALGNQSERYLVYLQSKAQQRVDKQVAERQVVAEKSRRALQGTFEAEVARQGTTEAIARNVAALEVSGSESRRALQWLVVVGVPALPQLHEALVASSTSDPHKLQLLIAISEIGNVTSIGPLIKMARSRPDGLLYRPAFQALALIDATPQSIDFAREQLGTTVAPAWRAAALVYLGQIRYQPAAANVEIYAAPEHPARVRVAALYLGARLVVPGVLARIEVALARTTDRAEREALLEALGEAASVQEFERIAGAAGLTESFSAYQENLAYCAFRTAPAERKVDRAYALLAVDGLHHRRAAMRFLVANDARRLAKNVTGGAGSVMPLHMLIPQSSAVQLLFSESRRMGYALEHTGKSYVLRQI